MWAPCKTHAWISHEVWILCSSKRSTLNLLSPHKSASYVVPKEIQKICSNYWSRKEFEANASLMLLCFTWMLRHSYIYVAFECIISRFLESSLVVRVLFFFLWTCRVISICWIIKVKMIMKVLQMIYFKLYIWSLIW